MTDFSPIDRATFQQLAEAGYNRIPLVGQVLADHETPLSIYRKLAEGPYSCLLESVQGGETWGRYSVIGLPAQGVVRVYNHRVQYRVDGTLIEDQTVADPLAWIQTFRQRFRVPQGYTPPLRLDGGLVGYFGYDTIRYIEPRLAGYRPPDTLGTPDILLMVVESLAVFDNLSSRLHLIVYRDPSDSDAFDGGCEQLAKLRSQLQTAHSPPVRPPETHHRVREADFRAEFEQADYEAAVARIKRYIRDGDAMQVVLSQRKRVPFEAAPIDLYRGLRLLNPSPYLFYLDLDDHHVVGSSPEILVRVEAGEVTVRPIAGTRPRGKTHADDQALEAELLADPKECAEHLMLIDLGRNDVGRISETGSVRVTDRMVVERYSHVMHIVSNVVGTLRAELDAIDVLRATFPAGTLSGAPKVRALEIIDELEPVKRGLYGGAVGYLAWNGNMDTAIAIRTALIKDSQLFVQAGAGIVHDSVPAKEWDETTNKGRAIVRAVALVEQGLDLESPQESRDAL